MLETDLLFLLNKTMEHFYNNIGENWFTYPNLYRNAVKEFDNCNFLEVGSWKGRSISFLGVEVKNQNKNINIHCVDTWAGSTDHHDFEQLNPDIIYDEFLKNIEPIEDIITPIRMTSLQASYNYDDEFFDFIFIDASHKYDDVLIDLDVWFPKLKVQGLFAGHDYGNGWEGVEKAVIDWTGKNSIDYKVDKAEYCWYLRK